VEQAQLPNKLGNYIFLLEIASSLPLLAMTNKQSLGKGFEHLILFSVSDLRFGILFHIPLP